MEIVKEIKLQDFKTHFKLEFDIKTDCKNMPLILDKLVEIIRNEFDNVDDKTEISVTPTLTSITLKEKEDKQRKKRARMKTYTGL